MAVIKLFSFHLEVASFKLGMLHIKKETKSQKLTYWYLSLSNRVTAENTALGLYLNYQQLS